MPPQPQNDIVRCARLDASVEWPYVYYKFREFDAVAQGYTERTEQWLGDGQLGSGGFGTVYRERFISGLTPLAVRAVKVMTKVKNKRYERELEALMVLSQKRVCALQTILMLRRPTDVTVLYLAVLSSVCEIDGLV